MAAFLAEPDIHKAVTTFCGATVNTATGDARSGCMLAAAALGHSERVTEIRSWLAKGSRHPPIFRETFREGNKGGAPESHTLRQGARPFARRLVAGCAASRQDWQHSRGIAGGCPKLCAPNSWRVNLAHTPKGKHLDACQIAQSLI